MSSISSWTEGILLSLAFVLILGIVLGGYNVLYDKNYNVPISDNTTEPLFVEYMSTSQDNIKGGEVAFDAQQGISLKSSYGLIVDVVNVVWLFISGGWIENTFEMLGMGASATALASTLRILYFISLVFAVLYALFKVVF